MAEVEEKGKTEQKEAKKKKKLIVAMGKRKRSVARAVIKEGSGKIRINSQPLDLIQPRYKKMRISEPLLLAGDVSKTVDITVVVKGGGVWGQADAIRTAIANAIVNYSRDEKLLTLQAAIQKLANLPAKHLKLQKRGELKTGYFADIVIFDPAKIKDNATYNKPHQYSEGMNHVFVNGIQVLKNGEPTGSAAGRFVKGPGYKK